MGDRLLLDVIRVAASGTRHAYWSTHCRDAIANERPALHSRCSATEHAPGVARDPARAKCCGSPCRCSCHGGGAQPVDLDELAGRVRSLLAEALAGQGVTGDRIERVLDAWDADIWPVVLDHFDPSVTP